MIRKFQLKNGLKVIFQQSHKSPVVSIQAWVRTGSADEGKKEEGISHFIEHLVFKGTQKFKVGEIASVIEGAGGELNAYTSFDQTVFYVTMSKTFIDLGLEVISEMMGFPQFDPTEINNEREVVIEEIKRGQDSLGRQASQLLFKTAFNKHPYGIPVIGYDKNVRAWSAKKIVDYYHSRYSPQNMFLVVTGDFEELEMKQKVTQLFGRFESYKVRKVKRKPEPKQKKIRMKIEKSSFDQSISYIAWKTPKISHADIPALDVLAMIMGQGDSSKLVDRLRIQAPIVISCGSSLFSSMDPGFLAISLGYKKENLEQALAGTLMVIQSIFRGEISQQELQKAIANIESENFYSMETVDGLSRKIGESEFLLGDVNYPEKYIKLVKKVTIKDLVRVARKYMITETLNITTLTNDDPVNVKKIWNTWIKDFQKNRKFSPLKLNENKLKSQKIVVPKVNRVGKENQTELVQLSNGVRVLIRPNFDTKVISVKAAFLGGVRAEPAFLDGMTELMSRSWLGGTRQFSETEIYAKTEALAAGIGPLAGRNSIGIGLDVLSPQETEAQDLFLNVMVDPIFPKEVVDREKKLQIEQIKSKHDSPSQIAVRMMMESLFGNHPYGKDLLGSEESLGKVETKDVIDHWKTHLSRKNMTIVLSGAQNRDLWLKKIEQATKDIPVGKKFDKTFSTNYPKTESHRFYELKKEQSHLITAYPGLRITDKDRYTLHIIQSILAGQGGRLFIELRDRNSLAYSVSPMRMEGIEAGYFGAYIGCSPDKIDKALEMMRIEFKKLCTVKVGADELERAKRYLIGRHDIDLQRVSAIASSILYDDIYGIPYDESFHFSEKYQSVTAEHVMRVAQTIFEAPPVVSVVGPRDLKVSK